MGRGVQVGILAAALAVLLLFVSCEAPEQSSTSSGSETEASTETPTAPTPTSPKPSDVTPYSLPSAPPEVAAAEPAAQPQPQNAPPVTEAPAAEFPMAPQDGEPASPSTAADGKPETVERTSGSAESGGMFAPEPLDGNGPRPPRGRDSDCIALGIEAANCTDYDKILASLRQAWTAYICPKAMIKNHPYAVSLVLDPTKPASMTAEEAKKAMAPELHADPAEVVARLTKMASHMSASLGGAAFKIEPVGSQKVTVTTGQPVHWAWTVTPIESGKNKQLTLTLSAYLGKEEGSLNEVQIKTLVENIEVNVSPWEEILAAIPTTQQGLAVAGTIFGILSAIWAYLNRSRIGRWLGAKTSEPENKGRRRRGKQP